MTRRTGFDLDDLLSERSYAPRQAYVRSKHAVQMFGLELDRRLRQAGTDVRSIVVHPGLGLDGASPRRDGVNEPTALARIAGGLLSPVARGKHRAARVAVRAAVDPAVEGGRYYGPARRSVGAPVPVRPPQIDTDPQLAARLWAMSEELTGVAFPVPAGRP
ncbi:hypothetical protein AB0J20_06485 [Micromonospora costi]|uniref:hypothetical protein n=1 Tax=Micromonospora costi TaxID=1530042 RepID=UPI0033D16FEA